LKASVQLGLLYFLMGNILLWFQINSQFVWDWWKDKAILSNLIFAIPTGLCLWMGVKNIVNSTGELWASKLLGFGVSNFVFAVMTYLMMKESILTAKTLTCLLLAAIIIAIQILWK
jgi:hypothetical protein